MLRTIHLGLFLSVVLSTPAPAASFLDRFTFLALFGDSLSDPGNAFAVTGGQFPPGPNSQIPGPYFNGRFTNGPNYADIFADEQNLTDGVNYRNYSFGGARAVGNPNNLIIDLDEQIDQFDAERPFLNLGSRAAALFALGGNDATAGGFAALASSDPVATAAALGRNAADTLKAEIAFFDGIIEDIYLLNLGDPALTPRFALPTFLGAAPPMLIETPGPGQPVPAPGVSVGPLTTVFADAFNAQLLANAAMLEDDGFTVTVIDIASRLDAFVAEAAASGLNTTQPCGSLAFLEQGLAFYDFSDATCDETDPTSVAQSLWFDDVHPTTTGHLLFAETVSAALAPIPLPASGLMFLAGLVALGALRRRA